MYRTDDPAADWDAHCREQEQAAARLPECCYCGERIADDYCYLIDDEIICEACMDNHFRKHTEDIMD